MIRFFSCNAKCFVLKYLEFPSISSCGNGRTQAWERAFPNEETTVS